MAQQMPNPIELYEAAAKGFRQTLSGVKENQMSSPTPCSEWNVQGLINHNIKVTGFALGALMENITVNPMDVAGPLPAEGSIAALDAGVAKVLELVKQSGSAGKQIKTPFGDMTRGEFLMAPMMDLLVHQWDLAKGTSQDTTLDSGLVTVCINAFGPQMDEMRNMEGGDGNHIFGPAVSVSDSATLQDKLIGSTGRKP